MPKLPIFRLRNSEPPSRPDLQYYGLTLAFTDLKLGVDNLRYDVFLSPRIAADLGFHLARYICRLERWNRSSRWTLLPRPKPNSYAPPRAPPNCASSAQPT